MPVPNFSPGEVLTASAMDSVAMWLVKTQTIGSAVSSVTVTDAFSADYDNYLITVAGGVASTSTVLNLRFGATVSGYQYQFIYGTFSGTTLGAGGSSFTSIQYAGSADTNGLSASITVQSPFLAKQTRISGESGRAGTYSGNVTGFVPNTTSYTSFTILADSGTLTGGTIRVYGYRN
jgi:hypothetical protein